MPVRHPIAFWAQEGTTDLIAFVEQDGDGERSLLRTCYVEREEEGDRELVGFFMREDGTCFAVGERVFDQLMRAIAEGAGNPHYWEDTIRMIFGAVKVDMSTVVFANEEAIELMSKTAEESQQSRVVPFLSREFSKSFPVREDASSPKLARPICSSAGGRSMPAPCEVAGASLEFSLDFTENASKGTTNVLIVTNPSADVSFVVQENQAGAEKLLRVCVNHHYDEKPDNVERFLLARLDGECCEVEISADELDALFGGDFVLTTETVTFTGTSPEGGTTAGDAGKYVYYPFGQQRIIDVIEKLVADSYSIVPERISDNPFQEMSDSGPHPAQPERVAPQRITAKLISEESSETSGGDSCKLQSIESECEPWVASTKDGEGFREGQSMNLPVPSNSARLNMSEGERKWYSSHWPFDRNIKHLCRGLTAGEKEWLSRLFDVDLNNVNVGDVVPTQERMSGRCGANSGEDVAAPFVNL